MNRKITLLVAACCTLSACNHEPSAKAHHPRKVGIDESLPLDSANKMLLSYLHSVNYEVNDTSLRSITIDADQLRAYLLNEDIVKVKLMFAHTLGYINSGHGNTPAGYKSGALTLVLACYDMDGNYVYNLPVLNPTVMDYGQPCPANCPTVGSAASDTLPVPVTRGGK